MALRKSKQSANRDPAPAALGAAIAIPVFGEHAIVAGQFAANDVLEMIPWPAGTIPHSVKIALEDLGTAETVLDLGVLTGNWGATLDNAGAARDCGNELANDSTLGQAGGSLDVAAAVLLAMAPKDYDRALGLKVITPPTTPIVGAKIRYSAIFIPAPTGVAIGS